jgi:hypothetical protein
MFPWSPAHQVTKSLRDFIGKMPGAAFGTRGSVRPVPRIPFVIRLGAAGPLHLSRDHHNLAKAVDAIVSALKEYADRSNARFHERLFSDTPAAPPARLRLSCQLAAGFDQMAASIALAKGYELHIVLPGGRLAFQHDIERNLCDSTQAAPGQRGPIDFDRGEWILAADAASGETKGAQGSGPVSRFNQLLNKAARVLELDRDNDSDNKAPFTLGDYAQAGSIILDHSDLILVAVYGEPYPALGGTRWIEQRAEEMDLTVIRLPVERPFDAELIWTDDGRREQRRLFEMDCEKTRSEIFDAALDRRLLGEPFDPSKTRLGWMERRMVAQLNPEYNAQEWNKRWQLGTSDALTRSSLGLAPQQIDTALKAAKTWADSRASAMAELVRGSFILAALLGVVAVFGALLKILFPIPLLASAGEVLEIVCLLLMFWFIWRSRRYNWRSQWLSLRQLERHLDEVAWLLLMGRGRTYVTPPHLSQFQTDHIAQWTNVFFHAVIRNSSFPTARLTADYLKTVHALVLKNLIDDQIEYFQREAPFQQKSDEILERSIKVCVITAGLVTAAYLFPLTHFAIDSLLGDSAPERIVPVLGALLPAAAAAVAAVRNHGEYAQIAARYEGAGTALGMIRSQLAARLPNRRPDFSPPPLRSAPLASIVARASDILIQEVQGWRAILQKKEIEPS